MKTTTFDASELGLLAKADFKLETESLANRLDGNRYVEVEKSSTDSFITLVEVDEQIFKHVHTTLRAALRGVNL